MKERRRLAEATAGRYRKAGKKEKRKILDEFVASTGFARSYAALVLRNQGREVAVAKKLRVRGDMGARLPRPRTWAQLRRSNRQGVGASMATDGLHLREAVGTHPE